ncbi:MAG: tRNA lysidine(34) synthetase TilS [Acidobacteriota bacterium]
MTRTPGKHPIEFNRNSLRAGMRLAVAVSGGADSVGLLRTLAEAAPEIGLVLRVAHVHHGIRGAEADRDERFVAALAQGLGLECWVHRVDTPAVARSKKQTLEEAARELRYAWFRELLAQGKADAVATAHTLEDQAETVLHRLVRGAWTEGLSGIHPMVHCAGGVILRPFLETRRGEIRAWLSEIGQAWQEDATNDDTAHTRNRIRHELMPQLAEYNPQIAQQLAHMATIARDEETWWESELAKLLPGIVLPGKPVRGGGRAVSTNPEEASLGIELERLRALAPAVRRRLLRAAAKQLGCALNFDQTERLMAMSAPEGSRKQELALDLWADKSVRELQLLRKTAGAGEDRILAQVEVTIPGEIAANGVRLRLALLATAPGEAAGTALLRAPRGGDRVRIRYSRGAKPLKEIFERMRISADARKAWPVLEWQGRIVWMKDVDLEPEHDLPFTVEAIPEE